jgi:hypothetical protein
VVGLAAHSAVLVPLGPILFLALYLPQVVELVVLTHLPPALWVAPVVVQIPA